jgi:hypothetical protein
MISKKATMSPAIVLLCVITLVLFFYSLFIFHGVNKKSEENIKVSIELEELYKKEIMLNFLIQKMVDESARNSLDKKEFIHNLVFELNKYQSELGVFLYNSDLEQIQNQLILDNVIVEEGKFGISLFITLRYFVEDNYRKTFDSSYSYRRIFLAN